MRPADIEGMGRLAAPHPGLSLEDTAAVLYHAADAIAVLDSPPSDDLEGRRFIYVNAAFEELYQRPATAIIGKAAWDFFRGNAARKPFQIAMQRMETATPFSHTRLLPRPDGSSIWIEVNFRPLPPFDPPRGRWMFISRDITTARAAQIQNHRLIAAVERASDPIAIFTISGGTFKYDFVNDAFLILTGYSREQILDRTPETLHSQRGDRAVVARDRATLLAGEPVQGDFHFMRADGSDIHLQYKATPVRDYATQSVTSIVVSYHSVTQTAAERIRLEYEANHDPVTGLYNRRHIERRLAEARERPVESAQTALFIDLDRFKVVNDKFGHDVGDRVLRNVAQAFQSCIWGSDVVGRWGGDEFVAILQCTPKNAEGIAQRMIESLAQNSDSKMVGASIGIAPIEAGSDALERADEAAYAAKRLGGNRFRTG